MVVHHCMMHVAPLTLHVCNPCPKIISFVRFCKSTLTSTYAFFVALTVDVVEQLLKVDPYLPFVMDVRGSLPLSYVQEKDYDKWMQFLQSREHEVWPFRVSKHKPVPPLTIQFPNTRPVPEPRVMLPSVFIEMLASGRMSPKEVTAMHDFDESSDDSDDSESDDSSSDDDDDDDDEEDDDEIELEDFDPDNCSFGRMSTGGGTFDFSESNHESGFCNIEDTHKDVNHVDENQTFIDNIDIVKCQSTDRSTENKARTIEVPKTICIADTCNGDADGVATALLGGSLEDNSLSNNTPLRYIRESDVADVKAHNTTLHKNELPIAISVSTNQSSEYSTTRSVKSISRTPVRVTTAVMKTHIQSSSLQRHATIVPSQSPFPEYDDTTTTITITTSRNENDPTVDRTNHQEIDLRQHCYWNHKHHHPSINSTTSISDMVVMIPSVVVEEEEEEEDVSNNEDDVSI